MSIGDILKNEINGYEYKNISKLRFNNEILFRTASF